MNLYQDFILDHYKNPQNFGTLVAPDKKVIVNNPLCGDKIEMSIKLKKGKMNEIAFTGEGCAISLAAASMLTNYAKGKPSSQLQKLDRSFILKLLGIELSPNRLKCALLPLEGLHKLIMKREA